MTKSILQYITETTRIQLNKVSEAMLKNIQSLIDNDKNLKSLITIDKEKQVINVENEVGRKAIVKILKKKNINYKE